MPYQRKYDFQPGTRISSSQVDEEFNNLINATNALESGVNDRYTKTESDGKYAVSQQEAWLPLATVGGWGESGNGLVPPRYYKDKFSMVFIEGNVWNGIMDDGTLIANLPIGYRPSSTIRRNISSNGNHAYVQIYFNGDIRIYKVSSIYSLDLSGISFRAEL